MHMGSLANTRISGLYHSGMLAYTASRSLAGEEPSSSSSVRTAGNDRAKESSCVISTFFS